MKYRLVDIHMAGNEHGQLKQDLLYAKLVDSEGRLEISATLEYILVAIRDRKLDVEGVSVDWYTRKRTNDTIDCSNVRLDLYGKYSG